MTNTATEPVSATDAPLDWRIDNEDPVAYPGPHDRLLQRLQGNIVKGHGRDFTVNIFLHFSDTATPGDIRGELRRLARKYLKSAAHQLQEGAEHRLYDLPGGLFANLFLTRTAYIKLGYESKISTWFADPGDPPNIDFLTGMKGAAGQLSDVIETKPEEPLAVAYADGHIDALLLLADDDEDYLLRRARQAVTRIHERRIAKVVAVEQGRVLRNQHDIGIEHFGYVDGRSQPLFLASDFCGLENGKIKLGVTKERLSANRSADFEKWNPFARLSLALLKDPGVDDADAFGSYYVFRKLEQNVKEFVAAEKALAAALKIDEARAGAMAVGRFRDGTPLVLSDHSDEGLQWANDFRYDNLTLDQPSAAHLDRFGLKCPFQSHIRKVSPRQDEAINVADAQLIARRIVRRGITYGERPDLKPPKDYKDRPAKEQPKKELPTQDVGLLFACFQRSITRQFAFVQERWASAIDFPLGGGVPTEMVGLDALIGQGSGFRPQNWRATYGGEIPDAPPNDLRDPFLHLSHRTPFPFHRFVKFRGGEFFFAPSLPFLLGR